MPAERSLKNSGFWLLSVPRGCFWLLLAKCLSVSPLFQWGTVGEDG